MEKEDKILNDLKTAIDSIQAAFVSLYETDPRTFTPGALVDMRRDCEQLTFDVSNMFQLLRNTIDEANNHGGRLSPQRVNEILTFLCYETDKPTATIEHTNGTTSTIELNKGFRMDDNVITYTTTEGETIRTKTNFIKLIR